ncbi:MAG: hypothetical protein V7739_09280 [Motiliproteus sp.]
MDIVFSWIDSLTSFQQGILGSFVFAVTSWFTQKSLKKAKSTGSHFFEEYSKLDVVKHTLHKEYVRSNNIQLASFGATIALLQASRWIVGGGLILIFFFGLNSIFNKEWLLVAGAWFTFNCLLEAWNWVKDSSHPDNISHVPEDVALEIIESLKPQAPKALDSDAS